MSERPIYKETSSFSLNSFPWREVKLRAAPSFPVKRSPELADTGSGRSLRSVGAAGGFRYKESAHIHSNCRNRFILWHYFEGRLKLLEVSLDVPLIHNALELILDSTDHLLPDVCIHELETSDVVILFATTSTAYRLMLPHPNKIMTTPSLSAVGEGLIPSVLAFVSENALVSDNSFISSNMAALFNQPSSVVSVTTCAACFSPDGVATFALGSSTGVISLIQLPSRGLPFRSELQEMSMMSKLWSSILPVMGRGGGLSEDAPSSVLLHVFDGQVVVISLCFDLNLRLWSAQLGQCVMKHHLSEYLLLCDDEPDMKVDQLLLKGAQDSTSSTLRFAIHLHTPISSQVSLFELLLVDNQLHLQLLHTYLCPQDGELVDLFLTSHQIWGVWMCLGKDGEGDMHIVKQAIYDVPLFTGWRDVPLTSLPSRELSLLPHQEAREFFLESIFHPGRFSVVAITKTLELYESFGDREVATSLQDLSREVSLTVEHELQNLATSLEMDGDEYQQLSLRCWSKFYGCCHEYQQLVSKPFTVFMDPGTGMGILLKHGVISFLRPADLAEFEGTTELPLKAENYKLGSDIAKFLSCTRKTVSQLSPDILDSFLLDLDCYGDADTNPPIRLAMDLADAIHEEAMDIDVYSDLCNVRDMNEVLDALLEALNPLEEGVSMGVAEEMDDENDYEDYIEVQSATAQLFSSPLSLSILSSAFQEVCHSRLCLTRDILIMMFVLRRGDALELMSNLKGNYVAPFSNLVSYYHPLHWLATRFSHPTSLAAYEANLQQLAALEISNGRGSSSRGSSLLSPILPLLYLSTQGLREVISKLAKENVLPRGTSSHLYWTILVPRIVEMTLRVLWSETSSCKVAEFLLENGQYNHLQDYIALVERTTPSCGHSLQFLLGQSFLYTGEMDKALNCFVGAASGIDSENNPLLQHLVQWQEGVEKGACMAVYFEKIMRLFEQVPAPLYVVKIAKSATLFMEKRDPRSSIFWSNLFKYHLMDFGNAKEAYIAMTSNPNDTLRMDCLHQLVAVLTERNRIQELCLFHYCGMEREVEEVMASRARSVDVMKYNYYDLLYCYHTLRNNYRKAAYVMYECALRLGQEASGLLSLQKQANCYSMTLMALHLVAPKYAWVVRPVQEDCRPDKRRSQRKRQRSGGLGKQPLEVLTISDIEKDYVLVHTKLTLIQRDPTLITQLSGPFVSAEEVSSLLVQNGMFETAISLSRRLSTPMIHVFEALASRCVNLSTSHMTISSGSQLTSDKAGWEWLKLNETLNVAKARENSLADKAWSFLRTALERLEPEEHSVMQKTVAKRLLSMGRDLPQWMLCTYKKTNPAELLNLYLTYDLLELAASLAIEFIDGVSGVGKEFFGLKDALHAGSPSVWLPHSLLSHLHLALKEAPSSSTLGELYKRFSEKLGNYLERTAKVTATQRNLLSL